MAEQARPPVAALVLGAAVWPEGRPSPTLRRRAERGAELWLSGEVSWIIGCGGIGRHPPAEGAVICDICRALAVPERALRVEGRSTTTEENLRFALPILKELGAVAVLIVTDRYHAPRAVWTARRIGLRAEARVTTLQGTSARRVAKAYLREAFALLRFFAQSFRR